MKKIAGFVAIALATILMLVYFYKTAFAYTFVYASDTAAHIRVAQLLFNPEFNTLNYLPHIEGYMLFHISLKILSQFTSHNYEIAASIIQTFMNLAVVFISMFYFKRNYRNNMSMSDFIFIILTIFVVALPLTGQVYLPQGVGSIWHNSTYIFMRPFGLISVFSFIAIYKDYEKCYINKGMLLLFSIVTFLSCFSKPSFVFTFLPVAGLYTLFQMYKYKLKNFKFAMGLLLAVTPTVLLLLFQYSLAFHDNLTIAIKFGTFLNLTLFESFVATLSVIIFPLSLLICYKDQIKNKLLLFMSWMTFIFGWLQYYFLITVEVAYGDFGWGYFFSIYLLYLVSLFELLVKEKSNKKMCLVGLFIIQSLIGLYYFYHQLMLGGYNLCLF